MIRENGAHVFKEVGALMVFQETIPIGHPFRFCGVRSEDFLKADHVGILRQDVVTD